MQNFTMTIDGKQVAGSRHFDVVNPADEQVFARCPDCTDGELQMAFNAAEKAFQGWKVDAEARRKALLACADALEANTDELAAILVKEQGKPMDRAVGEIQGGAVWIRSTVPLNLEPEIVQDDDTAKVVVYRKPLGVVAGITPWNYPVLLAIWKIAPALLAGNTLVLKPSPYTPLATLKLGEVLASKLPPGVFNVVSGGNDLGAKMTKHPKVRKISFTGSVATGKRICAAAADDLKRVTLELGGNDPAIVLGDNDPAQIAQKIFWSAFENSGQICVAVKRLYVQENIYKPVVEALSEIAKQVKVGAGDQEGVQLGPVNNRPQFERVTELIDDARQQGATIHAGGRRIGNAGYFVEPTIVTGLEEGSRLVDEEQFGPVLPVMSFRDPEEALERANKTHFGLGGSVWTEDTEKGVELASRLEAGTGWVNQHLNMGPHIPFGGSKWSGIGYENGHWGLSAFTEIQVVNQAKS